MSYRYEEFRDFVLSDEGQRDVIRTLLHAQKIMEQSGAATMRALMTQMRCCDSWQRLAVIDRLLEIGVLREVGNTGTERILALSWEAAQ